MSTEQWNTPTIVGSPFDRHQLSGQWHVFMTLYKMTPSACIRGGQDVNQNQSK